MIDFIIKITKEWYAELIAVLVGMFIVWLLGLLPYKYQYHKRLNFALKVSKVISRIELSIETDALVKIQEIKDILKTFLDKDYIDDIKLQKDLSFNSNKSGSSYKIFSHKDEELEKDFININTFNSFDISLFGRIRGLKTSINELQIILENLNHTKKTKDKITIHITIIPRREDKERERLQVNYKEDNFSTTYTIKDIKIVNNGFSFVEENVNKVFYEWMCSLL